MPDIRTPEPRRRRRQAVKTNDINPEWTVRRILYGLGYRYRLHPKYEVGQPRKYEIGPRHIVLSPRKKAIFVHTCLWHNHGCAKSRAAKANPEYWEPKLRANRKRDVSKASELLKSGFKVLIIWQCETADRDTLRAKLAAFVEGAKKPTDTRGKMV